MSHAEEVFRTWVSFLSSHNLGVAAPWSEEARLAALAHFNILDTLPEQAFDEIASLAAQLCEVPMAQINLIDAGRQWPKAQAGLALPEVLIEHSICAQTIRQPGVMMVDDLRVDPRFADNPLVVDASNLRFYAGTALLTAEGLPLGTLCVYDVEPRHLSESKLAALAALARQVVNQLELRRALYDQQEALRDLNEGLERRVAERTQEMLRINELLQVEMRERENAEEALRHAQKMDAIGQLTGGIAHDFNNMLTGVLGALELIQRRVAAGRVGEIDRYIDAAMTSANRAASLTHRLLAFARRQSLSPKAVDVNRMVISMEELLRHTLGESIVLRTYLQSRLWQANTDEHQLENALLNLVINARDAMPGGGQLTISTAIARIDMQQDTLTPGEYVLLTVGDSGSGMSAEVLGRAFDPFFTTKPIGQGTGLGLSMVYGFIKQTGGHVHIDSAEGQGTRIHLYLPCHLELGERHIAEHDNPRPPRALKGEQVLVVEDEVAVRTLVIDVLRELGYATLEACDGETALIVLQGRERIDLLVSDVVLPGLDGQQLADIARQHRPDLGVLFMTGYASNAEMCAGFLDQGMDMLIKPFSIDELALKVRNMIERARP